MLQLCDNWMLQQCPKVKIAKKTRIDNIFTRSVNFPSVRYLFFLPFYLADFLKPFDLGTILEIGMGVAVLVIRPKCLWSLLCLGAERRSEMKRIKRVLLGTLLALMMFSSVGCIYVDRDHHYYHDDDYYYHRW